MPWLRCKDWLPNRTPAPAMLSRPTIRITAILLAFFAAAAAVLGYDFAYRTSPHSASKNSFSRQHR